MARAVVRLIVGLFMILAIALMLSPLLSQAGAQPPDAAPFRSPQTITISLPTTSVVTATTTFPVFTTPTSSSVFTTPTTSSPTTTRPRVVGTSSTTSTSSTTTTSTTVAPIPAAAPPPVTLPLASAAQSGNINAFFPILSGLGFASLIGLLCVQWVLTKPGHRGPTL